MDQLEDSTEMSVFGRFVYADAKFDGSDAAALHAIPLYGGADGEGTERARDGIAIRAGIRKRANQHVPGNSGERIDITNFHGSPSV